MQNHARTAATTQQQISLFITTEQENSTFTLETRWPGVNGLGFTETSPGSGLWSRTEIARRGEYTFINLPAGRNGQQNIAVQGNGDNDEADRQKGLFVTAENANDELTIYVFSDELVSTDAYMAINCVEFPGARNYKYFIFSSGVFGGEQFESRFLFTPCQDDTTVSVQASQIQTHPAWVLPNSGNLNARVEATYGRAFNRFDTVMISNLDDLTGSIITSDKPLAVFSGHQCGTPTDDGTCDYLVEQLPPHPTYGDLFFVAPFAVRQSGELYRIGSVSAGAQVTINCECAASSADGNNRVGLVSAGDGVYSATVGAGQYAECLTPQNAQTYCCVTSSQPVTMAAYTLGNLIDNLQNIQDPPLPFNPIGDPALVYIPPASSYLNSYSLSAAPSLATQLQGFLSYILPTRIFDNSPQDRQRFRVNGETYIPDQYEAINCQVNGSNEVCAYGATRFLGVGNVDISYDNIKGGAFWGFAYGYAREVSFAYPLAFEMEPVGLAWIRGVDQVVLETVGTVDLMFSITRGDQSERSRAFADTQDLSAIAGSDYNDPQPQNNGGPTEIGNLRWRAGDTLPRVPYVVTILDDAISEPVEVVEVIVQCVAMENCYLPRTRYTITIIDDQGACLDLPAFSSGSISYDFEFFPEINGRPYETVATYECDVGILVGELTRTCKNGVWSGIVPICGVIPVRLPQIIRLTTRNLIPPTDGFEYSCVVNEVSLSAQYESETSIVCIVGSRNLTLSAGVGSSPVVVTVIRSENGVNNTLSNTTAVTLYDCRNLASGCSECIAARIGSEFVCGWCGGSCEVIQECSTDSFFIEGDKCPAPVINSFTPMYGPVEGGTEITVNGTDLGVTFADIQNSTLILGGVTCTPVNTGYMPGRQFVCETTNLTTEGPKNVSLTIGSRDAIVNAGSFTAVDPTVNSVTPTFGPMAGGTTVAVSGTRLDVGNQQDTSVSLDISGSSSVCNILSIQSHEIRCTTTASSFASDAMVVVSIDAARIRNPGLVFSYLNNPNVISVSPSNTISSGGIALTFTGLFFNVVQQPVLEVYQPMGVTLRSNCTLGEGTICSVTVNITTLTCYTPDLSETSPTALNYALMFDDVPPALFLITVQSDPSNFSLNSSQDVITGMAAIIHIVGDNLDSVDTSEIRVTVGGEECVKTPSSLTGIFCTAPSEPPGGENPAIINVTVGRNIAEVLDQRLMYRELPMTTEVPVTTAAPVTAGVPVTTGLPLNIIIPFSVIIIIGVLIVCVLILVVICFYIKSRRKSVSIATHQQNMELVATGITQEVLDGNTALVKSELNEIAESIPDSFKIPASKLKLSSTAIGQGEFGIVYKGVLTDWNHVPIQGVAVKTLKGLFSMSDVQSMVCEVNKMQDFDHPHVMSLIGVCLDAGPGIAIVMPYMANGSLFDYLKRERNNLELDDDCEIDQILAVRKLLLKICHQIALGMAYLAEQKFVHRDLAARNCMLDSGGCIRVGDFGLAEDVYATGYFRQNYRVNVKMPYKWMALESLNDAVFTEKTDVWSCGVTVWEIFNGGRTPYPAVDPLSLIQLLEEGRRLDRPLNAACATEISVVMRKCWREDPEERPTFLQLSSIVERLLIAIAGYTELGMVLVDTSQEEEEYKYDYVPPPTEVPHGYDDIPSGDPLTTENSAYGLGNNLEEEQLNNVPTLTPTESPHHYGDLLSVDPLTTENSAYGLGDNLNNVPTLTPTHHYGDLSSVDPLTTENSAYGLGEEITTTNN
ncbi:uncharacterized protein LOC135332039 isoform X3 [Halichondria panicea]